MLDEAQAGIKIARRNINKLRYTDDTTFMAESKELKSLLMKVKSESEVAQSCPDSSRPHGLQPTRLLCPWDFPGKSIGVGCHFLLQGIFLTQGLNPGLLHCRQTLYPLSHQGSLL